MINYNFHGMRYSQGLLGSLPWTQGINKEIIFWEIHHFEKNGGLGRHKISNVLWCHSVAPYELVDLLFWYHLPLTTDFKKLKIGPYVYYVILRLMQ